MPTKSKRPQNLGRFEIDEVLKWHPLPQVPFVAKAPPHDTWHVHLGKRPKFYTIRRDGPNCAACGRKGTHFIMQSLPGPDKKAQMILYGEPGVWPNPACCHTVQEYEDRRIFADLDRNRMPPVEMVVDHIVPQSLGGKDHSDNCHVLCFYCDNLKSDIVIKPDDLPLLGELGRKYETYYVENKIFKTISNDEVSFVLHTWRHRLLQRNDIDQEPQKLGSELRRKQFPHARKEDSYFSIIDRKGIPRFPRARRP